MQWGGQRDIKIQTLEDKMEKKRFDEVVNVEIKAASTDSGG